MSRLDRVIEEYLASDDPVPQDAAHEIGDGDFRAIGAEFLRHFVEIGGLTPDDDVLDIGCGFGRMALPLARYLAPTSHYVGFDIVREPVEWCRGNLAPRRPGFAFEHLDAQHPLYNPSGVQPPDAGFVDYPSLPAGWQPSFIAVVSVFTHLELPALVRYLTQARSILRPGGTLFATSFLTGDGTPPVTEAAAFPAADWRRDGPLSHLLGEPATAAVGIDWRWLSGLLADLGWCVDRIVHGHWRSPGDPAGPFQDVLVAR